MKTGRSTALEQGYAVGGVALKPQPVAFRQIGSSVDPPRALGRRGQFVGTVETSYKQTAASGYLYRVEAEFRGSGVEAGFLSGLPASCGVE